MGIGILPGIGGGTGNVMAYTVAKNCDKHLERFGTGCIDGVVASETAINATIGGAMVPPGILGHHGPAAGRATLHGLTPGPLLFQNQADIVRHFRRHAGMQRNHAVYGVFRPAHFVKPEHPAILPRPGCSCCAHRRVRVKEQMMSQVIACLIFGAIGLRSRNSTSPPRRSSWALSWARWRRINHRRGLIRTKGSFLPFLTSPISAVFLGIAVLVIVAAIVKPMLDKTQQARQG